MSVKGFFFILVFFLVAIMGFLIYISETVVVKYLYIAEALMLLLMLVSYFVLPENRETDEYHRQWYGTSQRTGLQ